MVKRRRAFKPKDTRCMDCANAVPCCEEGRGCEWSILSKPVPGWTAVKTGTSYRVMDCPKYREG